MLMAVFCRIHSTLRYQDQKNIVEPPSRTTLFFKICFLAVALITSFFCISNASAQALARGEDGRTYIINSNSDGRFVPITGPQATVSTSSDGSRSLYITSPSESDFRFQNESSSINGRQVKVTIPSNYQASSSAIDRDRNYSSSTKSTPESNAFENSSQSSSKHSFTENTGLASSQNANLPLDLYTKAVMEDVEADEDFNYSKVNKISSLPVYPKGYRAAKNLVDKVVVNKMEHAMYLYKGNHLVRKYWIALSDRPQGTKIQEGDKRTPEGTYTLDYVKNNSYYYRAFHISYPNPDDIARARALGVRPGGMIMVHGQPPSGKEYQETVQRSDWTNGCIALLNPEMDEFINLVDPGTQIVINP